MPRVQITGSHGTLIVDSATGDILEQQTGMGEEGYPGIRRFDPATLTGSHLDILECGYWHDNGYEPPEPDFMAHIADLAAGGKGTL